MKGFTIVELMVTVAIIAILAVVVVPQMNSQISRARDGRLIAFTSELRSSINLLLVNSIDQEYPLTIQILKSQSGGMGYSSNLVSKDDDHSDGETSLEVKAGRVRKADKSISKGTEGDLNGVNDVLQISYNKHTGKITMEGIGSTDYLDTRGVFWKLR